MATLNFNATHSLPYHAHSLMKMVKDVEQYPSFLPQCQQVRILKIVNDHTFIARVHLNLGAISTTYQSTVTCDDNTSTIHIKGEKPFVASFHAKWHFLKSNSSSHLSFHLSMNILPSPLTPLFKKQFPTVSQDIFQAFLKRAHTLYSPLPTA